MLDQIHTPQSALAKAPCVLFAYHALGHACFSALLEMGAPIGALFTHSDAPDEEIWWESCLKLACSNGIPAYVPAAIDDDCVATVARLRPAIIYSFNYRTLLPDELLRLAPLGAYNLHGALLPRYRGRAPVNWVLVNGEHETGVTLHHMVRRADAGDIVGQRRIAITDDDDALSLLHKMIPEAVELVRRFHPLIAAGCAPRHPQDLSKGNYVGRRRPQDGLIDWRWPARRVFNLVRAVTHPYPGAFCHVRGRKLFVWRARIAHESGKFGIAGEVLGPCEPQGALEVAAGEGSVAVIWLQFADAPEGYASEVLRGWQPGDVLQ